MIQLEDIVEYEPGDGRQLLAHVDAIFNNFYGYEDELVISFLTPDIHPQTMRVPASKCTFWDRPSSSSKKKCECGWKDKKVPLRAHGRYCPLFKLD